MSSTTQPQMKRVVVDHYGGPEVLRVVEEDDPRPGPGEVRVRVLAAGVSFTDAQLRAGTYLGGPKPPFTPGYELVGVVEELGPGCSRLRVGDRIGALTVWGADAERVCVPEANAVEVPEDLDPAEVLSLVFTYMTAYQVLHRTAKVKSGETVLVHGAAGRVGTAVLELGAVAGLRLYGTCFGSRPRRGRAARRGGDRLPQRGLPGAGARADPAKAWTSCSTGSAARCRFAPSARCGPAEGSSCSATTPRSRTGARAGAAVDRVVRGDRGRLRSGACSRPAGGCSPTGSRSYAKATKCSRAASRGRRPRDPEWFREDFRALLELLREGKIHPVVAERLPLSEARRAHELLESSAAKGKLVLVP